MRIKLSGWQFVHGKLNRDGSPQEIIAATKELPEDIKQLGLQLKRASPLNQGRISRIIVPNENSITAVTLLGTLGEDGRSTIPGHYLVVKQNQFNDLEDFHTLLLFDNRMPIPGSYEQISDLPEFSTELDISSIDTRSRQLILQDTMELLKADYFFTLLDIILQSEEPLAIVDFEKPAMIPTICFAMQIALPRTLRRKLSFTTYSSKGWQLLGHDKGKSYNLRFIFDGSDKDYEQSVLAFPRRDSTSVKPETSPYVRRLREAGGIDKILELVAEFDELGQGIEFEGLPKDGAELLMRRYTERINPAAATFDGVNSIPYRPGIKSDVDFDSLNSIYQTEDKQPDSERLDNGDPEAGTIEDSATTSPQLAINTEIAEEENHLDRDIPSGIYPQKSSTIEDEPIPAVKEAPLSELVPNAPTEPNEKLTNAQVVSFNDAATEPNEKLTIGKEPNESMPTQNSNSFENQQQQTTQVNSNITKPSTLGGTNTVNPVELNLRVKVRNDLAGAKLISNETLGNLQTPGEALIAITVARNYTGITQSDMGKYFSLEGVLILLDILTNNARLYKEQLGVLDALQTLMPEIFEIVTYHAKMSREYEQELKRRWDTLLDLSKNEHS